MSKLANMLNMLLLLQRQKIMKISELADELEVTPRQIRRYRDELEMAGYYIESTSGKHGGYYVTEKQLVIKEDPTAVVDEKTIVSLFKNESIDHLSEVVSIFKMIKENKEISHYVKRTTSLQELKKHLRILLAIKESHVLEIEYVPKNGMRLIRIVHPYFTFEKREREYLVAYNPEEKKMIYLLLARMIDLKIMPETFTKDERLWQNERNIVVENTGVFYGDHLESVRIKVNKESLDTIHTLFEGTVGILGNEEGSMIIELKVGNVNEVIHKVLSMGNQVEVLEPLKLRSRIISQMESTLEIYRTEKKAIVSYDTYHAQVKNHLGRYVKSQYPNHVTHPKHDYILDPSYPVSEALIESNRKLYELYVHGSIDIHSKGNLKSSQLMALDLFLPYFDKPEKLMDILGIDERLSAMTFEKVCDDYTHVDVYIETESNTRILCEVKLAEKDFDRADQGNPRRTRKYLKHYQRINEHMTGRPVSEQEFMENYQLFRNLFQTIDWENGRVGYLIVVYPRKHVTLDLQFETFYRRLKDVHGYAHMKKIRKVHAGMIGNTDELLGKYIFTCDRLIKVDIMSEDDLEDDRIIDLEVDNKKDLYALKDLFEERKDVSIRLTRGVENLFHRWRDLEDLFGDKYDVVHGDMKEFKDFDEVINLRVIY